MTTPMTFTLVGGPTAVIEYAGLRMLTDPTFDPPGVYEGGIPLHKLVGPALSPEEVGGIDVVLLSHDQHPDNLDHAGRDFLSRASAVLSTPEAASRIAGVIGLAAWETHSVGDVEIVAVPALHGPEGAEALSGPVTGFLLRAPEQPTLSDRELEVLRLVAQGETNRGVAARLFVSEATVKTHLLHIYTKLDVNDRAAAVAAAYERGLITPHAE